MLRIPGERPGATVPPLVTLPVTVPAPCRIPPWILSVELVEMSPPFRTVCPAVCVNPPLKARVPVLALTMPALLKGIPTVRVPVPVFRVKVPDALLLKRLVPPPLARELLSGALKERLLSKSRFLMVTGRGVELVVPLWMSVRLRRTLRPLMVRVAPAAMVVVPVPPIVPPDQPKDLPEAMLMAPEPLRLPAEKSQSTASEEVFNVRVPLETIIVPVMPRVTGAATVVV